MIAFFDTSVHVDVLTGRLLLDDALQAVGGSPVRLSLVVASELLRSATGSAVACVDELVRRLVTIEPPSWRRCWIDTGRLLPKVFRHHEAVGLARLQNDVRSRSPHGIPGRCSSPAIRISKRCGPTSPSRSRFSGREWLLAAFQESAAVVSEGLPVGEKGASSGGVIVHALPSWHVCDAQLGS